MNRTLLLGVAAVLAAAPACAASPFDGTWTVDLKTMKLPAKPRSYLLKSGTYTCSTCTPPITVAADGAFHKTAENPYFDEVSVTVVDPKTVKQVQRKGGKVIGETSIAVAPDNKTAVYTFSDASGSGTPVTGKGLFERVAAAPAGAHAISGSWKSSTSSEVSNNGLALTFKLENNRLSMTSPTGSSYVAPLDGSEALVMGDPGWTTVSVKQTGPQTLVETDYRDHKPIAVLTMTVSPDGKAMSVLTQDKLRDTTSSYTANKQ